MKKINMTVLALVMIIANFTTAFAGSGGIKFVEVRPDGSGTSFVFQSDSVLSRDQLNTMVRLNNGSEFPMYCNNQKDKGLVVCEMSHKVDGGTANFYLGGNFWQIIVPETKGAKTGPGCFNVNVYDWPAGGTPYSGWAEMETLCLDFVPADREVLEIVDDVVDGNFTFSENGPVCDGIINPGTGLYYNRCPGAFTTW